MIWCARKSRDGCELSADQAIPWIADRFKRTPMAIYNRLEKFGLVEDGL